MKPSFKVRLTPGQLEELLRMYGYYIALWESTDQHELLLLEHALQLQQMLQTMHQLNTLKKRERIIGLTTCQALAFILWWGAIDTAGQEYGNVIICRIVGDIDHSTKQILTILEPLNIAT